MRTLRVLLLLVLLLPACDGSDKRLLEMEVEDIEMRGWEYFVGMMSAQELHFEIDGMPCVGIRAAGGNLAISCDWPETPPIICIWDQEERVGKVGHISEEFQYAGELDAARMLRAAQTGIMLDIDGDLANLMEDYIDWWVTAQEVE
jgi:hypothetical protein